MNGCDRMAVGFTPSYATIIYLCQIMKRSFKQWRSSIPKWIYILELCFNPVPSRTISAGVIIRVLECGRSWVRESVESNQRL